MAQPTSDTSIYGSGHADSAQTKQLTQMLSFFGPDGFLNSCMVYAFSEILTVIVNTASVCPVPQGHLLITLSRI